MMFFVQNEFSSIMFFRGEEFLVKDEDLILGDEEDFDIELLKIIFVCFLIL